jgi:hypothetical protein
VIGMGIAAPGPCMFAGAFPDTEPASPDEGSLPRSEDR